MSRDRLSDIELPDETFVLWILLLVSVAVVTGSFVAAAVLFPHTVGALISGQALLGLGLGFVGSLLVVLVGWPSKPLKTGWETANEEARIQGTDPGWNVLDTLDSEVDRPVFVPGVIVSILVVGLLSVFPARAAAVIAALEGIVLNLGRPVLFAAVFVFVVFALAVAVGPWGRIRLGDDEPAFSTVGYLAMLFSAGIAAGIVFWGPVEALLHYETVPPYSGVDTRSEEAIVVSLQYTIFHWGLSAWSTYLVIGLPIAYAAYNMGAQLRVSAVLVPILGSDAVERPIGRLVDVLAVVATLGGLSTTLGFVSAQFLAAIDFGWGIGVGPAGTALLILGLTTIVVISTVAGVSRGMGRLSLLNTGVFCLVVVFLLVVGPTGFILGTGSSALVVYVVEFVPMSFFTGEGGDDWIANWTAFYWLWWLSWAPFVGLFLARISRGRRIRTVVFGMIGATFGTLAWFVVVGSTSLWLQHTGAVDLLALLHAESIAIAGYPLFDAVSLGGFLLGPFLLLVITFIVTSADAATRSLAIVSTGRANPSNPLFVFFGGFIGSIATVLLIFGGQEALESAAILTGAPVAIVGLIAIVGFVVALRDHDDRP